MIPLEVKEDAEKLREENPKLDTIRSLEGRRIWRDGFDIGFTAAYELRQKEVDELGTQMTKILALVIFLEVLVKLFL